MDITSISNNVLGEASQAMDSGVYQIDAQFFTMYLFQFSTCFEQPRAHHQENQLYQYNLWYMSLCVGDRFMCRSERNCQPEQGVSMGSPISSLIAEVFLQNM